MEVAVRRTSQSLIVKRSVVLGGHKTSISLESDFWRGLKEIAAGKETTVALLVSDIDVARKHTNLSSACRLFVLDHYKTLATLNRMAA